MLAYSQYYIVVVIKRKRIKAQIHNDQERERQWTLYVKKQSNMLANKDRERKKEKKKKARKCVCRSVRERERVEGPSLFFLENTALVLSSNSKVSNLNRIKCP